MEASNRSVVFYSTELSVPYEEVKKEMLIKDELLNRAISHYASELTKGGIEIWDIQDNIIVTESGYKFCIYKDMIESAI